MLEKKGLLNNKKADAVDIILFTVLIFFFAISFIVGIFINDKIKTDYIEDKKFNYTGSPQNKIVDTIDGINVRGVQRAFVIVVAFLIMAMMISAFRVPIHPIWMFIWIIFLIVAIFTNVFLGNVYQDFIETDTFAGTVAGQQDMINYIMNNIILITLATGAMAMVITFSRAFGGFQGGATQDL